MSPEAKTDDLVRRAREKFDRAEAFELRVIAHGWRACEEVSIFGAPELARKILKALDALAILHAAEDEAAEQDEMLRKINESPEG